MWERFDKIDFYEITIFESLPEFLEFGENSLLKKSGGEVVVNKIRSSLLSNVELYLLDEPLTYLDYNDANKIANLIKRTLATW